MRIYEKILIFVLFTILLGELLAISVPLLSNPEPSIELIETTSIEVGDNIEFKIRFSLTQGKYPLTVKTVLMPVYTFSIDKKVYIYYDENYPSSFVSQASWIGFIDHLLPELKFRGYSGIIEIANSTKLNEVMVNDYDSIVIIPSGVFPETVHTKENSLIPQFLENGGILIWIGDGFGIYSGKYRGKLFWSSFENPGWEAQEKILGYRISYTNSHSFANISNPLSNALDLEYPSIQVGAFINQTLAHNGLVLGKSFAGRTSIAAVPVGKGFVVIFGGGIGLSRTEIGEDIIARDIAKILLSQVLYSNGQLTSMTFQRESTNNENLTICIPKGIFSGVVFIAYSADHNNYFFFRKIVYN